jgi:hypothetical protein
VRAGELVVPVVLASNPPFAASIVANAPRAREIHRIRLFKRIRTTLTKLWVRGTSGDLDSSCRPPG